MIHVCSGDRGKDRANSESDLGIACVKVASANIPGRNQLGYLPCFANTRTPRALHYIYTNTYLH